jgi:hypothetical protein
MVRLKDVMDGGEGWFRKSYHLKEKDIYLIGRAEGCDVKLGDIGRASRHHAIILRRKGNFYVGDISSSGTSLKKSKGIWGHYDAIELRNILKGEFFKKNFKRDGDARVEFEAYRAFGGSWAGFDYEGMKRNYLVKSFLFDRNRNKNVENIDKLIEFQELMLLRNGDIIEIFPAPDLEFKDGIFSKLMRRSKF